MEEAREREIRVGLLSSDSMVCDLFRYLFATKENTCSCVYITLMRERHLAISLNRLTEKRVATEWRCQVLLAVHRTVMRDGRSVLHTI